jgi:hypothetical protein
VDNQDILIFKILNIQFIKHGNVTNT